MSLAAALVREGDKMHSEAGKKMHRKCVPIGKK